MMDYARIIEQVKALGEKHRLGRMTQCEIRPAVVETTFPPWTHPWGPEIVKLPEPPYVEAAFDRGRIISTKGGKLCAIKHISGPAIRGEDIIEKVDMEGI